MDEHNLPFKVGQLAESRSFIVGYRGAWFRSKIKEIGCRKNVRGHALEYFDFPDEKIRWTKLYQKPPLGSSKSKEMKRQLMVRPCFPPVYSESQMPDINTISEVVVIVNDIWKVGDMVDWWTDGCYWSGRITEILGDERVRIELAPPPVGEGSSYEVFCKDLRPSLDWSPNDGWTVPNPMDSENSHCCARLIKPTNLASSLPPPDRSEPMVKRPLRISTSMETHTTETNMDFNVADSVLGKTSCLDSVSSSHARDASPEKAETSGGKGGDQNSGSSKKMKTDGSISLNSRCSDTIEAAILDLEELVNRVKWIRNVLEFGTPLPDTVRPWKFLEHRASSTPK